MGGTGRLAHLSKPRFGRIPRDLPLKDWEREAIANFHDDRDRCGTIFRRNP